MLSRILWPSLAGPALGVAMLMGAPSATSQASPRVVATIKPVHSLVASVMAGSGIPDLMIKGAETPHTFSLTPSGARQLERADLVFMIGGGLEPWLSNAVRTLVKKARIIELISVPGVQRLAVRLPDSHQPGGHGNSDDHQSDPHIWLDPINAKAMVTAIGKALAQVDTFNEPLYGRNSAELLGALDSLSASLNVRLGNVVKKPFFVYHDAFQYFEKHLGLNASGAIIRGFETRPGVRHIREIRQRMAALGPVCIFREPGFPSKLIQTITVGLAARVAIIDPLGADLLPGPSHYFNMMRHNSNVFANCLGRDK